MAAAAALHPCSIGHSCKLLVATLMLLLAASAILLRNSKHRSAAHQLGRGFIAGTTQSASQALPTVHGGPRKGRTPAEEQLWLQLHDMYVAEAQQLAQKGVDLVFYGDSITEAMRGTTMGYPNGKHAATPAVVQRHYGHIRMAALSLAGDTTLNLLWRVQNGEGPAFSPKVAVLLIGTNDLTNPVYALDTNNPTETGAIVAAGAVAAVQAMLRQSARMHVILLAITPRGERFAFASAADKYSQPSRLSPAIAATNMHLKHAADGQERVTYVDCNAVLLKRGVTGGMQIDPELMPDSLHPNAKGMDLYLDCLDQHLKPYLPVKRDVGVPH